ncbi:MAG: 30S ribosomal protein S12 methylthiotransferase accessory factor YcaO, partial [Thiomonas sp.]|nr:30S ribosomal protein S12 methylthiotransferase accessory factor YcaO [Thiomonas sp.]
ASLEQSIATLRGKLSVLGFHIEERSWLNPVEGVWSVHVRDHDCALLFSNGKGASELAARASALGEFVERLSTHYFWTHFYLGEAIAHRAHVHAPNERWFPLAGDAWPEGLLNPELRAFYNPHDAVPAAQLVDLNSGNVARGICALPYQRLSDGATAYFPVNLIGNLYVSNGMSAGNTLMEARTQALSEIFERHVKFRIIREALCLPDVPEAVIARYPHIAAGIRGLREAGFGILVKDASLGGRYPVMNVTLLHPGDQGCFASFGAHPRFEIALERALTELLQGRALDALAGFPAPGFDLAEIADPQNLEIHFVDSSGVLSWEFLRSTPEFDFADWNFGASTEEDYHWSMAALHAEGHQIYVADFTQLGVYACRILVPGASEIYPVDELEYENNSVGITLRADIARLPELSGDECVALYDQIVELELADERPVSVLIGLAPDPDTAWAGLKIGELKLLLALASGDDDAILEGCAWLAQYGQRSPERLKVFRCIADLLRLQDATPYAPALRLLYGADTLDLALALLNQEQRFWGLTTLGPNFEASANHSTLLAAYRKVCD